MIAVFAVSVAAAMWAIVYLSERIPARTKSMVSDAPGTGRPFELTQEMLDELKAWSEEHPT